MKLFLISQTQNQGYDTYDSAVVCAPDEHSARNIHPSGDAHQDEYSLRSWCSPENVLVEFIGIARDDMSLGVVCASFNAG